jgi:GNAT superfamily N-acetyltransferase
VNKSSGVEIRSAVPGDEVGIAKVHVQSWLETYTGLIPDSYLQALSVEAKIEQWKAGIAITREANPEKQLFVAEKNGSIVGFSSLGKSRGKIPGYSAEIYAIYVLKELHGQGIGMRLMEDSFQWVREHGMNSVALWVLDQNPTIEFYHGMGFQTLGQSEEIDFSGEKHKHIAMGLTLGFAGSF